MDDQDNSVDAAISAVSEVAKAGVERGWIADADGIDASGPTDEVAAFIASMLVDGVLEVARLSMSRLLDVAQTPFVGVHARIVPNPGDLGGVTVQMSVAFFERMS